MDIGGLELGTVGLLLLGGVILFFFPEPLTSTVGIALIVIAILIWAANEFM